MVYVWLPPTKTASQAALCGLCSRAQPTLSGNFNCGSQAMVTMTGGRNLILTKPYSMHFQYLLYAILIFRNNI